MAHTIAEEEPRRSRGHALKERLSRAAARARATRGRRGDASQRDKGAQPEPPWGDLDSAMGQPNQGTWPPADEQPQPAAAADAEGAPEPNQAPPESEPEAAPQPEAKPAGEPAKRTRARKQAKPRAKRQTRQRTPKRDAAPQAEKPKPARK